MEYTINLDDIDPATQMPSFGDNLAGLEPVNTDLAIQMRQPLEDEEAYLELDDTVPAVQLPASEGYQACLETEDPNPTVPQLSPENNQARPGVDNIKRPHRAETSEMP